MRLSNRSASAAAAAAAAVAAELAATASQMCFQAIYHLAAVCNFSDWAAFMLQQKQRQPQHRQQQQSPFRPLPKHEIRATCAHKVSAFQRPTVSVSECPN